MEFVLALDVTSGCFLRRQHLPTPDFLSYTTQVYATWCPHSAASFAPFVSAAARFLSAPKPPRFLALTKCEPEKVREFIQRLSTVGKDKKAIENLHACAFACDISGLAVDTLQSNFRCEEIPRVYVIDNGTVEWDGHPVGVEEAVARVVGMYDSDSDEADE